VPLTITYVGHATVRIEADGKYILTDPIFSQQIFWLKRRSPLPCKPESLGEPEAVFVSHAHYDHLDIPSYKYFSQKVPIIVPPGLKGLLRKSLKNPVLETEPPRPIEIGPGLRTTPFPVKHTGFRVLPFRYTRCNGYLIDFHGYRIFFPGDTAYRGDFPHATADSPIHVALLPISCYRPEWFMRDRHINPAEAVRIFEEIGARYLVPIHWGTFKLSTEPMEEPIEWLGRLALERGLRERVKILPPGESLRIDATSLRLAAMTGSK